MLFKQIWKISRLLVENELPARGGGDFREVGVEPVGDRGDKNILGRK